MITEHVTLLNETVLECLNETDEKKIIKTFGDVGLKVLGADFGFVWLTSLGSKKLKLLYTSPHLPFTPRTPRRGGRNYSALKSLTPNFVSKIRKTSDVRYVSKYVKSFVIIPLVYKQVVFGNMVLCFKSAEPFPKEKRILSTFIGNSVAQTITIHRLVESEHNARVFSEKQKAHFKALIENSYEIIVHLDEGSKILYMSPSGTNILGTRITQVIREILRSAKPSHIMEFRHKQKDGTVLSLEAIVTKLPRDLDFGGTVINIWDVTERKELERAKETERLLEEEKFKVSSMADVAHELRTPLAIIQGNVDLAMQSMPERSKPLNKTFKAINYEIKHLSTILSNLSLVTSKAEQFRDKIVYEEIDVQPLILGVIQRCKVLARKKNVSLTADIRYDLTLAGDMGYLEQMLVNLIKNSIIYGNKNGRTEIKARKSKGYIIISVIDNGVGISKEDLPRVFERFYRADKSHTPREDSTGTGLGLPIVKWVADIHGGTIAVKSTKNKGSVFSVSLPIKRRS